MKNHDILLIGDTPLTRKIANRLAQEGQDAAIVSLPGFPETIKAQETLALRSSSPIDLQKVHRILFDEQTAGLSHVVFYQGPGRFTDKKTFQTPQDTLSAKKFIISTGCVSPEPTLGSFKNIPRRTPMEILQMPKKPKRLIVVGTGWRATAWAQTLASDSGVHLITGSQPFLKDIDEDIRVRMLQMMAKCGIVVWEQNQVPDIVPEALVIADDWVPNTSGFDFPVAGIYVDSQGRVVIHEECQTSAPDIWAMGSVTGARMDYAVEKQQADVVFENVLSQSLFRKKMDLDPTPQTEFTIPTYAELGLTEKQALTQYPKEAKCLVYDLKTCSRGAVEALDGGMIKIVAKSRGANLLGVQILAPHAEEMIIYFDLIMRAGIPLSEFGDLNHFPAASFGEAIGQSIAAWIEKFYC